jgi:hypothetical protein
MIWQGLARSNCFAIKDLAGFSSWLRSIPGLAVEASDADQNRVLVWADHRFRFDRPRSNDFLDELLDQVAAGEVAVLVDAQRETGSSVGGAALAYRAGHDNLLKLSLADLEDPTWSLAA